MATFDNATVTPQSGGELVPLIISLQVTNFTLFRSLFLPFYNVFPLPLPFLQSQLKNGFFPS